MDDVQDNEELCDSDSMFPLFGGPTNSSLVRRLNLSVHPRKRDIIASTAFQDRFFVDDIWPGAFVISDLLVSNPSLVLNKTVLELGAGVALPSLVSSRLGAACVVTTDFPAPGVLDNITQLLVENEIHTGIRVASLIWGEPLDSAVFDSVPCNNQKFDVILMAELLWKDTYPLHEKLLKSLVMYLCPQGLALMAFAHRPTAEHSPERDLEFLEKAREEFNLRCTLLSIVSKYRDVGEEDIVDVFLYQIEFVP